MCDELKPAATFRQVIGRITTEACADCCDLRDEMNGARIDPLSNAAIAEFCLRLAKKRFERARLKAAPNRNRKEKSALAKDPKDYQKWLQTFPDRVAAIVAKTYAVMGDDAIAHGLPNDVALVQILDLLNAGDDTLIVRNANKKLARPRRSS